MPDRTASDYGKRDARTHIYENTGMYGGSTSRVMSEEFIFDFESKKMVKVNMDLPEAAKRIFLEILSNAGDNAYFSKIDKIDPGMIEFNFSEDGYLSIRSGGKAIPVEPHNESTSDNLHLIPTEIFSVVNTSSNYDKEKDRLGSGINGVGSKLTNVLSKNFIVKVGDSGRVVKGKKISGQEYYGEWKDNMKTCVKATSKPGFEYDKKKWQRITKNEYKGEPYVEIIWKADFEKFELDREYFTQDEIGLFSRYILEFSLTCGVPVKIIDTVYDYRSIRDFAGLFFDSTLVDKSIIGYDDKKMPSEFKKMKKSEDKEKYIATKYTPQIQYLLLDTPNDSIILSYVNGLFTVDGGIHVDEMKNKLSMPIVKHFNDKHGKGKIKKDNVIPHISIILVCRFPNPDYDSQSKKRMTALKNPSKLPVPPKVKIDIDANVFKTIFNEWNLMEYLENLILMKNSKEISKTDGKKIKHIKSDKGIDANQAGTSKSHLCTLYIVEGQSAASYPTRRISHLENIKGYSGKDLNGVYPLQGKVMNVKTHTIEEISKYKEFEKIKQILGLKQGMDYSIEKNFKTLRYGKVMINVDADSDGMHIMGLIFNLFREYWKELFARGFIQLLVTPVVRIFIGKKTLRFYDERSFNKWNETERKDNTKYDIKYYKGLGTSNPQDIKDDVKTAPTLFIELDQEGEELIERAFDGKRSDDRKNWIEEWRNERDSVVPYVPHSLTEVKQVSELMSKFFPNYMTDSIIRAIPSKYDGLKQSQRQALYYGLHHFNYGSKKETISTDAFSNGAKPFVHYHHGGASLEETIKKMTRNFYGGNNLPFFEGHGEFGTRRNLGKDAAQSRYSKLRLSSYINLIYDKDLVNIVDRRSVDGMDAEPYWIAQTIPLGLVNGNKGMATGYSSFIPMHHPIDIADWIIERLNGKKKIQPLIPYYNGFKGELNIYYRKTDNIDLKNNDKLSDSESDDDPDISFTRGRGFDIYGKYDILEADKNGNTVNYDKSGKCDSKVSETISNLHITEIPFTVPLTKYVDFLKELIEKKIIMDFRDNSNDDEGTINIEVKGIKNINIDYDKLGLRKSLPLTNMYLVDKYGVPQKYNSIESILAEYVNYMLDVYTKYKKNIILAHKEDLTKLNMEIKIINAYIDGDLKVHKKSDEEVDSQLKNLELNKLIFDKMNIRNLTKTRIDLLLEKISGVESEIKYISEKSPEDLWKANLEKFKKGIEKLKIYKTKNVIYENENHTTKKVYIDGELSYKEVIVKSVSI